MRFGLYLPNSGPICQLDALAEIARRGDCLGFHCMVTPDHIASPLLSSRHTATPWGRVWRRPEERRGPGSGLHHLRHPETGFGPDPGTHGLVCSRGERPSVIRPIEYNSQSSPPAPMFVGHVWPSPEWPEFRKVVRRAHHERERTAHPEPVEGPS